MGNTDAGHCFLSYSKRDLRQETHLGNGQRKDDSGTLQWKIPSGIASSGGKGSKQEGGPCTAR